MGIHPTSRGHISAPIASYFTDRAVSACAAAAAASVVCFYLHFPSLALFCMLLKSVSLR